METKRPAKGIETLILSSFSFNSFSLWKPKDPPRGLRLISKCVSSSIGSGNQKTRQGDCDFYKSQNIFHLFVETKRPAKGIATHLADHKYLLGHIRGNQKTRQGDCDFNSTIFSLYSFNFVETKRPAKGIATSFIKENNSIYICGNQKTRQGDCDYKVFSPNCFHHITVETKRPAKGIATSFNTSSMCLIASVETKRPAKGIATLRGLPRIMSKSHMRGNQKTRQGDCDSQ